MKTVDIKGKSYVMVNERILFFRGSDKYKGWSLETDIIELTDTRIVTKTIIRDAEGRLHSTGLAYEKEGSTFINKTSYIENAETSSAGRALGFLGIGIDGSIASAEEVGNAVNNQGALHNNDTMQTVLQNLIKEVDAIETKEDLMQYQSDHMDRIEKKPGKLMYLEKNDKEAFQEAMDYIKQKAEIL